VSIDDTQNSVGDIRPFQDYVKLIFLEEDSVGQNWRALITVKL